VPTETMPTFFQQGGGETEFVGAQTTPTCVLNTNSKVVTGAGSGADLVTNPFGVMNGTVTNHANVIRVPVPENATYLDIANEWVGTNPTTDPIIRAYGNVGSRPYNDSNKPVWPADFDTSFYNPSITRTTADNRTLASPEDFKALGDMRAGTYLMTVGEDVSAGGTVGNPHLDNGTSKRGKIVTLNVTGVKEVIIVVATACVGPTKSMLVGWFGK